MTIETDNAARALRQELHDRTLLAEPERSYQTIADLQDICERVAQLLKHIEHATDRSTDVDDPDMWDLQERQNKVSAYLYAASDHLRTAVDQLGGAHVNASHLIFGGER